MKSKITNFGLAFLIVSALVRCGGNDSAVVTVQRGVYNQPSIKVESAPPGQADFLLFEKQGYVEAQDRFLQMDMLRRVSQGRLSEIFGEAAKDRDTQMIAAGLPLSASRSLEKLKSRTPEVLGYIEAFARGVNTYLHEQVHKNSDLVRSYRRWTKNQTYVPDPWQPLDSVSVAESIAFFLSSNIQERLLVGKIAKAYFPDLAELPKLFDIRAVENTFILQAGGPITPHAANLPNGPKRKLAKQPFTTGASCVERGYPFPPCFRTGSYGSNNWVVSKEFAGGNQSFLANDPHLQLSFPNNFIEMALDSTAAGGTFKVRGVNLPGVPGVLIGHNQHIAWGFTNNPADVDEVYIDKFNQEETEIELANDKRGQVHTINHVYRYRASDGTLRERIMPLRETKEHGLYISDYFSDLRPAADQIADLLTQEGEPKAKVEISYKWVGHPGTTEAAAVLHLNRACNFDEFRTALNFMQAGAQNIVYADTQGNIGYYSHGDFPVRKYLNAQLPPNVPIFGSLGFEWEPEFRKDIPQITPATAKGRIVTANNDPYGMTAKPNFSDYQDYFGNGFDVGSRAKRITEMLDAKKGNLTLADMQAIQTDTKDLFALKAIALMGQPKVQLNLNLSPKAKSLRDTLLAYDGNALRDRQEPGMVQVWLKSFGRIYFKELLEKYSAQYDTPEDGEKESDKLFEELVSSLIAAKTIYHKMNDLLSPETPSPESLAMIAESLETAADKIDKEGQPNWGQINKLSFFSPLTGIFPSVSVAPIERSGSWATVNVAGKIHGPNFRMVLVLEEGKPIEGVNVLAGGNYSPLDGNHWLNELMLWRDGKYRDLVPFVP